MESDKKTKIRVAFVVTALLTALPQLVCAARPVYHGLALAYPLSSELPEFTARHPFIRGEHFFDMVLSIDESGRVLSVIPERTADSLFAEYLASAVTLLSFEPAMFEGELTPCLLPVAFSINPRLRRSEVTFPVSSDLAVDSRDLYQRALEKNGIRLPALRMFPPYFSDLSMLDSLKQLPFVLEKLTLNSSGSVTCFEGISSSLPGYVSQIESASLWAEFSPLILNEKPMAAETYLLVLFIPQVQYPTRKLVIDTEPELSWSERWRVQTLADTVGLMVPPIPTSAQIDRFTMTGKPRPISGDATALLRIDTTGKVKVRTTDKTEPKFQQAIAVIANKLSFLPAMDFHGNPQFFEGKARFQFRNSKTVRIKYFWLD